MSPLLVEELNQDKSCKTYLVSDAASREAAIVDPLLELVERYAGIVRSRGLALRFAVDTHTHADHLSGAREVAAATGAVIAGAPAVAVQRPLREGDVLKLGDNSITIWASPGHTADSLVLVGDTFIITGDTLLIGATGRTDLPSGDAEQEWQSLQRVLALPDQTVVWPGHDYAGRTSSTIGDEKRANVRVRMPREEFIATMRAPRSSKPALLEQALAHNTRPIR